MLPTPCVYRLVASTAEGLTKLTAFDRALLGAGVGNCNLLKVSSILPAGSELSETLSVPEGALLPIAYASMVSNVVGQRLCAGVAVGLGDDGKYGVIMEYHGLSSKSCAEAALSEMLHEAFAVRQRTLAQVHVMAVEHVVAKCGCAFAAVPLWYK